jgi:tight adherence protein C
MLIIIIGSITLFLTIILLVVGLYRSSSKYAVEQRIERMQAADAETVEEELSRPFVERVLLPIGGNVARLFRGYTPEEISERTEKRLIMAGMHPHWSATQLQGVCLISTAATILIVGMMLISFGMVPGGRLHLNDPINLLYLLIAAAAGYTIPQFFISKRIQARQEGILLTLPYAIDLLSISVEAGMGFDAAVGYVMRKIKGPLAEEFAKTLNEIRLGKPRLEALEELGRRTGVEDLRTFITAVVHASRMGGSITNTLRVQSEAIRVRRRQRAQEQAMKAPVKMVFPLVLFIFPALFVVILGPAFMSIMKQL